MIGLVIVTHGELAAGLIQAARMIIGEMPSVVGVSLKESQSIEGLQIEIEKAVREVDHGEGVLIFVDMIGASPLNCSAQVAAQREDIEAITGVNLPMLLETAMQREFQTFDELVAAAVQAGRESIRDLTGLLNN